MKAVTHSLATDQGATGQRVSRLAHAAVDHRPQAVAQRQLQQQLDGRSATGPSALSAATPAFLPPGNDGVVQRFIDWNALREGIGTAGGYLAGKAGTAGGYLAGGARTAGGYLASGVRTAGSYAATGFDKTTKFLSKDTPGPTGGPGMGLNIASSTMSLAGQGVDSLKNSTKYGKATNYVQAATNGYIALADVAGMGRTGYNLIKKRGDGKAGRRLLKIGTRGLDATSNVIQGLDALNVIPPSIKPYTAIAGPVLGTLAQMGAMRHMATAKNKPGSPPSNATAKTLNWLSPISGSASDASSLAGTLTGGATSTRFGLASTVAGLASSTVSTLNTLGLSQKMGTGLSKAYNYSWDKGKNAKDYLATGLSSAGSWIGKFSNSDNAGRLPTERDRLINSMV